MEFFKSIEDQANKKIRELNDREIFVIALLADTIEDDAKEAYNKELKGINEERTKIFALLAWINFNI